MNENDSQHEIRELFLSLTNQCNLTCTYCSADAGPDGRNHLDVGAAEAAVREWIATARHASLSLVFSGGEPTLWGYDNLDRVCGVASAQAARLGKELTFGVQSNGTRIGARFIEWCVTWDVVPSFSLDGLPHLSDRQRGKGEIVVAGLKRLRDLGLPFGVIMCLTTEVATAIDEVLDWCLAERFLKIRVNTLGFAPAGRSGVYPNADLIHGARTEIYDHMERYGSAGVREKNVAEMIAIFDAIMAGTPWDKGHCTELQCGAGKSIAALNPDGRWVPCIEKSMTDGLPRMGSLGELEAAMTHHWQELSGWDMCRACAADPICDHGCPVYHKLNHDRFSDECAANRHFWTFLLKRRPSARPVTCAAIVT